jgi:hypothetical protein
MNSLSQGKSRISKRVVVSLVALAIAAPAALASSTPVRPAVVHAQLQRSGTVVVSGYDGGAPLAPAH